MAEPTCKRAEILPWLVGVRFVFNQGAEVGMLKHGRNKEAQIRSESLISTAKLIREGPWYLTRTGASMEPLVNSNAG